MDVIDLQSGLTLLKMDKTKDALDQFFYVDSSFAGHQAREWQSYETRQSFLDNYRNFDTAYYYFNRTSASAAPQNILMMQEQK